MTQPRLTWVSLAPKAKPLPVWIFGHCPFYWSIFLEAQERFHLLPCNSGRATSGLRSSYPRKAPQNSPQKSSVQFSRSVVPDPGTPWTAACQASLSITNSQSSLKLMSIELVMPSNQLILCRPLLLMPSIFPSIRVFSNKSVLHIRWPKYWSFSISHSSEYSGLITQELKSLNTSPFV